jgi:RNA polymerase sigma-70 factor (ECF subfamily)
MGARPTPTPAGDESESLRQTESPAEDAGTSAEVDWAAHIRVHGRRVVLALVAAGFSFERARDLAGEAWTRLIEKHRSGRITDIRLPGLAIVQARFLAWQERRRERRLAAPPAEAGDDPERLLVDHNPTPEQRVLTRQQAERALAVIATLPPSAQRLFRMLARDPGVSHAHIAEVLGLSLQRVRQILCELRKTVRIALEGDPT